MAEGAKYLFFCQYLILLTFCSSEVLPRNETEQKDLKTGANKVFDKIPRRDLLEHLHRKTTLHDSIYPPNSPTFTPTVITIPAMAVPVTVTITPNPTSTPVPIPSTTTTVPVTNPVTTPGTVQPITNPVTSYPAPTTGVPVATPVTTGAPAFTGQSWCVAKSGAAESALQVALDYACGIGGADCSVIQDGGGCYNPNSLESHASYAFNSYYQKNPVQTSCDFGGIAVITYVNPSTGTCIYQSSLSSSSSPTTATTPSPTTTSSQGSIVPGTYSLPSASNASNLPASGSPPVFRDGPPSYNSSASMTIKLQPFVCCIHIILLASYIIGEAILDV